jgi:hypothetical protein
MHEGAAGAAMKCLTETEENSAQDEEVYMVGNEEEKRGEHHKDSGDDEGFLVSELVCEISTGYLEEETGNASDEEYGADPLRGDFGDGEIIGTQDCHENTLIRDEDKRVLPNVTLES